MKNLNQFIKEKYLIDIDTQEDWSIENAKDGDFCYCEEDKFFIYKGINKNVKRYNGISDDAIIYHALYFSKSQDITIGPDCGIGCVKDNYHYHYRLATPEEKQKFIEVLKKYGYKWDNNNKKLIKI